MKSNNRFGGLDVCSVCWEPLTARERRRVEETQWMCGACTASINEAIEDIDDIIDGRQK